MANDGNELLHQQIQDALSSAKECLTGRDDEKEDRCESTGSKKSCDAAPAARVGQGFLFSLPLERGAGLETWSPVPSTNADFYELAGTIASPVSAAMASVRNLQT